MANGTFQQPLPAFSDWMSKFEQDTKDIQLKMERELRESQLTFSLVLGDKGLGGSGTVFIPAGTSDEEKNKLLKGKVVGYIKEITPMDLGEDSEYTQTGQKVYYGDPSTAKVTTQKGLYYIPGRGWNKGSATGVTILDDMKGGGLRGKTKDDFTAVFTIFGEKPEDAYDEEGEYKGYMANGNFKFAGKTTINVNGNEYDFIPDFKNASFENRPSTLNKADFSDITTARLSSEEIGFRRDAGLPDSLGLSSMDMVVDPFDFSNTMKYFSMNTDQLSGGGILGGDHPTPMSETGQIAPSGEDWWNREITILKTYKHKNEDGSSVDVYETHNEKVTNQIANVIVGPLPDKPTKEEDGSWYYGGEVIPEEDALEIIVLRNEQITKRRELYESGWRIYYPEEKLLNSEMGTYLDSFEQMFGDDYIDYVSDFSNRADFLEYAWNLWTGPIEKNRVYYGKEEYYGVNWSDLNETDQDFVLKTLRYWDSKGDDLTISSFSEFADFYTGFNPYPRDEKDKKIFLTQVNKVNKIFKDTDVESNVPKKFIQMNNLIGWGEAINDFSAMITPIMVSGGYVGTALASSSVPLQMAGQGMTWATFGGLHDYTRDEFDYNWDRFLVSRGLDFTVGSLFAPFSGRVSVPFKYKNTALGKALQQYFVGNPLGTFSKNSLNQPVKEGSYRITQWLLPAIKFESQVQGMNVLLTSHNYAETLNRNIAQSEKGLWLTDPDGDAKFVEEPAISQIIAKTTQDVFGPNSSFGKHLMVQQGITHLLHGFPIFKPKKVKVYVDEKGIKNPFNFKGNLNDLKFDPKTKKWYTHKGSNVMGEPEWKLKQTEVTLGPLALRNYYRNYMQHTSKWIENHYLLGGKQSGLTLHGDRWKPTFTIEDHQLWMDTYFKTLPFRDHTMNGIIKGILNLEGKMVNGKVLTKDDVRGITSNYVEIYKRVRNNPNFMTLNELRMHELEINNYVGAGMEWNFRNYGDVFGGINTTSMVPFLPFESNMSQIRFQGDIPKIAEPITNIMTKNPIFKKLDVVFLPEEPLICLTWDKIRFHDPFADLSEYEGYKLINEKGDVANGENFGEEIGQNFDTGQDIYVVKPEDQNTIEADGSGQVIYSKGVGKEALIEGGIVEPLYKLLDKVDPELKAEIDALMNITHQELIRLGISGDEIDITELFSKAFTYNALGYAESDPHLAEFMHLPKDIIDRFSKWILYETGESIESIMGTQPPKEAPYKDISHILYGEPIDGGKIIYEGTSYKLSKNVNSKKNHIYVNKSESIINKLESVSLKQRGVKNYLKRHGLNDPEIKELNIDGLLSKYKPTDSIPKDVLVKWIKDNTFVLTEIIRTDPVTVTGEESYEPTYPTETRYDIDIWGESFNEQKGDEGRDDFGQYIGLSKSGAEELVSEEIDYFVGERVYEIEKGDDAEFYLADGEWENGVFANEDMTIEKTTLNESNIEVVNKHDYKIGDKIFNDESEFREWLGDDMKDNFEIKEYEYIDYENPTEPVGTHTDSEGNIVPLTQYQDSKLKGGENYKELLIINPFLGYDEPHWSLGEQEKSLLGDYADDRHNNVIGHIRFQDIHLDGKKVLNIENIQSKLHQKGAVEGYYTRDEFGQKPTDHKYDRAVPEAPLKDEWIKVHLNRIFQYAIDNGYDGVSLNNGEQMAKRWNALTYVDKIEYKFTPSKLTELPEGTHILPITKEIIQHPEDAKFESKGPDHEPVIMVRHPELPGFRMSVPKNSTHIYIDPYNNVKGISFTGPEQSIGTGEDLLVSIETVEEKVLHHLNVGSEKNKEYDIYFYDKDGRSDHKFMNKDELIPTFGSIIGNEIINGTAHSTVDKAGNNQTGEVDVEVTFNVLDDVDKTTYGRN